MKIATQPLKLVFILLTGLLFSEVIVAKAVATPETRAVLLQTVDLKNGLSLQYRYINGSLKYIAIKNTSKPTEIVLLGQYKVLGTDETYVFSPPPGVASIQLDILGYPKNANAGLLETSLDKDISKRTYLLLLPEAPKESALQTKEKGK